MTVIHVDDVEQQQWEVGDEISSRRKRLGAAANAKRMGIAIMEIPPGKRPNPPHSHADEEEIFFVLAGSGLSYQATGTNDAKTYEVRAGDFIRHQRNGPAHTLIAGSEGLTVLIAAEGSATGITYLPRTKQFWLGPRWSPADSPPPFKADAALPPLDIPDPSPRPADIRNLDELEVEEGRSGKLAWATRMLDRDEGNLVLAHDTLPPDCHNTDLHFHSAREEAWYVKAGSGIARLGDEAIDLRAGSFFLRRPNGGVGHRIEVGSDGMELITMGDLIPGDVCVYPEKRTVLVARGVEIPYVPREQPGN